MKLHYLVCGLKRHHYKTVLEHLDKIFSRYEIIYYFMNDESENDFYDKEILGNRNYKIINFDKNKFIEHINKYGSNYKYTHRDIQFYKIKIMVDSIIDYDSKDIFIRGRSDFLPIFNNSGLNDINNPSKGWKQSNKPGIIIDKDISLENYDTSYLYHIGVYYKKHPYQYMFDGWFMSNYENIKKLAECGIMYNNEYKDNVSIWKNGNPVEAQLLRNLLNNNVKIKTISDISSCIYYR